MWTGKGCFSLQCRQINPNKASFKCTLLNFPNACGWSYLALNTALSTCCIYYTHQYILKLYLYSYLMSIVQANLFLLTAGNLSKLTLWLLQRIGKHPSWKDILNDPATCWAFKEVLLTLHVDWKRVLCQMIAAMQTDKCQQSLFQMHCFSLLNFPNACGWMYLTLNTCSSFHMLHLLHSSIIT